VEVEVEVEVEMEEEIEDRLSSTSDAREPGELFPQSLLVLRHEDSALHEALNLYPDDPARQTAAMDAWRSAQPVAI
jgi:hypothetical protein